MKSLNQIVDSFLELAQGLFGDVDGSMALRQREQLLGELEFSLDFFLARYLQSTRLPLESFDDLRLCVVGQCMEKSLPTAQRLVNSTVIKDGHGSAHALLRRLIDHL